MLPNCPELAGKTRVYWVVSTQWANFKAALDVVGVCVNRIGKVRISKRRRICVSAGHRRSSLRLPLLGAPCPNGAAAACAQTIAPYASNPQAIRMAWTIKAALFNGAVISSVPVYAR